ncbi:DNA-cytosine methyltransferase [Rhodomicrobium vannielii ATCC 17100]|uniref:DNA (cytosine-5-)-methyltransferase n=1 Tax=Rhodomicrobium vannielii (strain ATCC 17100 / DSM 162 / LMG 4299 / NCIMB 10020 / ATH 3.1.1) TaxID=648757 RepID=E3I788_RHOVT|nr:DNA cytosine methyltransferase [Rhodomicrobium vannielii]ADP70739.1 DNA-cytosine methyltransferase [Rhodomicrobium vannielii ATCC 17100]
MKTASVAPEIQVDHQTVTRPDATVVDLFCGAGGLSHGFHSEGFDIVAGIDTDETCRYAFEHNNDAPFIRRDVAQLKGREIEDLFVPGRHRVLVGCAPCQPFSTYNQKNDDPKWKLLSYFAGLIDEVRPDVVSMENVPRLLTFKEGAVFREFVDVLENADYHVIWKVLYGPDFGLAQTRSRLVLLASRRGPILLPTPTHKDNYRTVMDEIGELPPLGHGESDDADPLHCASRLSDINVRRIAASKPGGTWREWGDDLVAACHKAETGRGYSSVYGRMKWEEPSPTITTQFFGFGNGRFGHPEQARALSLREGAMLQGFPRDYEFVRPGERIQFKAIGRLIGNAVPVKLAAAIARAVKKHLEEVE